MKKDTYAILVTIIVVVFIYVYTFFVFANIDKNTNNKSITIKSDGFELKCNVNETARILGGTYYYVSVKSIIVDGKEIDISNRWISKGKIKSEAINPAPY